MIPNRCIAIQLELELRSLYGPTFATTTRSSAGARLTSDRVAAWDSASAGR
jgi:hypothetical protein